MLIESQRAKNGSRDEFEPIRILLVGYAARHVARSHGVARAFNGCDHGQAAGGILCAVSELEEAYIDNARSSARTHHGLPCRPLAWPHRRPL